MMSQCDCKKILGCRKCEGRGYLPVYEKMWSDYNNSCQYQDLSYESVCMLLEQAKDLAFRREHQSIGIHMRWIKQAMLELGGKHNYIVGSSTTLKHLLKLEMKNENIKDTKIYTSKVAYENLSEIGAGWCGIIAFPCLLAVLKITIPVWDNFGLSLAGVFSCVWFVALGQVLLYSIWALNEERKARDWHWDFLGFVKRVVKLIAIVCGIIGVGFTLYRSGILGVR